MTRRLASRTCCAAVAALAVMGIAVSPVKADEHRGGHEGHFEGRHEEHHEERGFRGGEDRRFDRGFRGGAGLFFGAPFAVAPPPVYYAPAYPYAPVPISGVYATAYGYCRDYRTAVGIETACQQPDGVWRFIN